MVGGFVAALVLVPIGMPLVWNGSLQAAIIVWAALSLLSWVFVLAGCFSMRFELAGPGNKTLQATPAPPCS